MGRRFCITEIKIGAINWDSAITENELINRCNAIRKPEFITGDKVIEILLGVPQPTLTPSFTPSPKNYGPSIT